jgi:hypothetical protein
MTPVFLSASLPDPRRHAKYHLTADLMAIRECVRALATVVLSRTRLVFGGHPAITPLIRLVGERLGGMSRIRMYQSAFFREHFPADNDRFSDVVVTQAVADDREASLLLMREEMIASEQFGAGVFVGGMEGVEQEFDLFRSQHPNAKLLPVASTGAAARLLFSAMSLSAGSESLSKLASSRVYGALFEELLDLRLPTPRRRSPAPDRPRKKGSSKKKKKKKKKKKR